MVGRLSMVVCLLVAIGWVVECPAQVKAGDTQAAAAAAPATRAAGKIEPLPDEKGKPFAVVQRAKKALELDGKLDEGLGEPTLTSFYSEDTGKAVKQNVQTQVWLRYDDENLYVIAKMLEPAMDELQATTTERDGEVWQDDDLEIFLDPAKKADPAEYFQIIVNPAGTIADQRGAPDVSGDSAWDCKGCKVKTGKGKDFWVVEMAVPFQAIGVKGPVAGKHWGANFGRDRKAGDGENSSWVNIGADWHQPEEFGHIAFE